MRAAALLLVTILAGRGAITLGGESPLDTALWALLGLGALLLVIDQANDRRRR